MGTEEKSEHRILQEKTQKFIKWFEAHSPEKAHKCFDTDSPSCRHGVQLALDIVGKGFINPNGCIHASSCDLNLVLGMSGKKASESQPKFEKERKSKLDLAFKNKIENEKIFAALTSRKEFAPTTRKNSRESISDENEFTPTAREFSPESTTNEFTSARHLSQYSTTDEIPRDDDPTPCSNKAPTATVKYFDESKIVAEYRTQVNGEVEGINYKPYRRSRKELNPKREIIVEAENVLLYREKFEGKERKRQKPYESPQ